MAVSVQASGELSLAHARKASQQLEEGNFGEAKTALVKAEISVMKHVKEIIYLIERYTAVQEYYMEEEKNLTAKINDVHSRERSAETQKSAAETRLRCERDELYRHECELSSARDRFREADEKRKANNTGTIVTGVVAGLLTVFSFGAAAPITAPLAVGATAGAIAFNNAADDAKDDMHRSEREISSSKSKISQSESTISSLSNTISQLNAEKCRYMSERSSLQDEKGRIKKVIVFLQDAQTYGSNYTTTAEACIQRTALTGKVVGRVEAKGYSLFDCKGTERVLSSFEEAWDTFEEMNTNGSSYNFEVEFCCSRCSSSKQEFPHVISRQLICASCHDESK